MPNHIKNRIKILATEKELDKVLKTFGTSHEEKLDRAHDGTVICKDKRTDKFSVGWLDEKTNIFCRRNEEDVIGLPEGWEMQIIKAFLQFPDFDKVFEIPKELKGLQPHHGIVTAVKKKYEAPISSNQLLAILETKNRIEQSLEFEGAEKELFEKCCIAYEKTGYVYWYDWQIAHWGTKWNSYSCKKEKENVYTFETAWSGVPSIIEEISKRFPDVGFLYEFADEYTGYNVGYYEFLNGMTKEVRPEGGTKEAYELAFNLRPEYRENYRLIDGAYEYIEEEEVTS